MREKTAGILYLHNQTGISGGERSLLNLWKRLDRERFGPHLVVPGKGPFSEAAEAMGVSVSIVDVPRLYPGGISRFFRALGAVIDLVRDKDIRLIHSYTPRNNILSSLAGKFSGIPVIWHERNLLYGGEKDVSRRFMLLPEGIICNSRAVAERFSGGGAVPGKVRVILNGVDLEEFSPRRDASMVRGSLGAGNRKIVGAVSNLNRRKRAGYFLEMASALGKSRSDVLFVLVGGEFPEGSGGMDHLKKRARELGLGEDVVFTGFREDTASLLSAFDVFVHVTEKEACSRAIIEAMASGKPVVAMDSGGNPELVEDGVTGVLVPPDDIEALAGAVSRLADDPELGKKMGFAGRERSERLFDAGRNAAETERFYTELIEK